MAGRNPATPSTGTWRIMRAFFWGIGLTGSIPLERSTYNSIDVLDIKIILSGREAGLSRYHRPLRKLYAAGLHSPWNINVHRHHIAFTFHGERGRRYSGSSSRLQRASTLFSLKACYALLGPA